MVSFRAKDVPFEILYRYRPHQYGDRPVRFFILANDKEHKMGESPLPDGMIRVFRETGQGGLSFYTAQPTKYIPIKEKIELNVGKDDQVVYERVVLDVARQNFIYERRSAPAPPVVGLGRDAEVAGRDSQLPRQADQDGDPPRAAGRRGVRAGGRGETLRLPDGGVHADRQARREVCRWRPPATFHLGRNQKQNAVRLVGRNQ